MVKEEEIATTNFDMCLNGVKFIFAISPLLGLGYILYTGFDDVEEENIKRSKKTDFTLNGHEE